MELRFTRKNSTAAIYTSPTFSENGIIAAWKGKHSRWKHGFVVRVLWFGLVVRWGKVQSTWPYRRSMLDRLIEQANDGDYLPLELENFET